jgi:hypothetical protein
MNPEDETSANGSAGGMKFAKFGLKCETKNFLSNLCFITVSNSVRFINLYKKKVQISELVIDIPGNFKEYYFDEYYD